MPSVALTFFFVALVILLGFIGSRVFQLTRFPDVPILLSLGLLIGPINRVAIEHGLGSAALAENISVVALKEVAPFVGSAALIVILFDSGLKLDFAHFGRGMRPAFLHTLPLFLLTVATLSLIARYVMGMPVLPSVVLGVALSNVGQTVSAAILREIDLHPEVRSIYFIEMAIYDLVSIPIIVGLLEFAQESAAGAGVEIFLQNITRVAAIAILIGFLGGLLWIEVLRRLGSYPYAYMVTFAGLLLVYSLNSFLGGSGPVSVLVFGLVIGNQTAIVRLLKMNAAELAETERVQSFHNEITFFVRTFFFIFLGITFSTGAEGGWNVRSELGPLSSLNATATLFFLAVVLMFVAILGARYFVVRFISARKSEHHRSLFAVYGRGLGTAVLATLPFAWPAYVAGTGYHDLFSPWEPVFLNTALLIILFTVMGSGVTVWLRETKERRRAKGEAHVAVSGEEMAGH